MSRISNFAYHRVFPADCVVTRANCLHLAASINDRISAVLHIWLLSDIQGIKEQFVCLIDNLVIKLILQNLAKKCTKLERCFWSTHTSFRIWPKCCLIRVQTRMSSFVCQPRGSLSNIYCLILQK